MIYKEENYYDGQWKFNKMTGIGTLYKNEETILYHGNKYLKYKKVTGSMIIQMGKGSWLINIMSR